MFPDAHAACVVDGIRDRSGDSADTGFAKALDAVKPAGLQTIDEDLRLFETSMIVGIRYDR